MKKTNIILFALTLVTIFSAKSQITSTDGLNNLKVIQGDFIISATQISDVDGFIGLNHVSGDLIIRNNASLTDYCGLRNLFENGVIEGNTIIEGNQIDLDPLDFDFSGCKLVGLDDNYYDLSSTYPNPVTDELNFSQDDNVKVISIFNALGVMVLLEENTNNKIDLSSLPEGYYTVQAQNNDNEILVSKILKK